MVHPSSSSRPASGDSDIFLHVQTRRAGKVKGEGRAEGHADDIVVRSWTWGVSASAALGNTAVTSRRSYRGLTVVKDIDSATTSLMSALVTNDEVKEVTLTMRKSGGEAMDYLQLTLKGARVSAIDHDVDAQGGAVESVTFLFTKVEMAYRPQTGAGAAGAALSFSDEILAV